MLDELFAGPPVVRLDASNGGHVTDLAWLEHERWRSLEALVLDGNWLKVRHGAVHSVAMRMCVSAAGLWYGHG